MSLLIIVYVFVAVCLSIYGFNAFLLMFLYFRHKAGQPACPVLDHHPVVTVQLPVYNEQHVVKRAIDALARLDWPQDRLQIQVLDDSTDETMPMAAQAVELWRQQGVNIELCHRTQRTGFKAGALNSAMERVEGEFIAMFDADFQPSPDFLLRTVPHLVADPDLGFVQARWGHLNDEFSLLTLAQAAGLDGHMAVEHIAREGAGLLTNFCGTAGVWRRACIEECGGWDGEMLTEDLDLSYRAQFAGWRGLTLVDVVAPAELPAQLASIKRQQFRWAKGNIQCLLKLGRHLLAAPLPLFARLQGLLYLGYYLAHPLMLLMMCINLPLIWYDLLERMTLPVLGLATLGPPLMYTLGQWELYRNWRRFRALPVLICLGTGLAVNTTVAAIEAFFRVKSPFERTPKFRIEGRSGSWQSQKYTSVKGNTSWGEILAFGYALLTTAVAVNKGELGAVPFLLLYVAGFGFVSILGLIQARQCNRQVSARRKADEHTHFVGA